MAYHEKKSIDLHAELLALTQKEKQITSEILGKLQDMENQRGYLRLGYNSLFDYLVRGLKYSEATAYQRQACVRLTQELPEIKQKIDQGTLTVSSVSSAFKQLRTQTVEQKRQTLAQLENKSTREVKKILAPDSKPILVKKTEYRDRVHLRLELSHEQNKKLEKLRALKSHKHNLESLIESLIDNELKKYELSDKLKSQVTDSNRMNKPNSKNNRYIPKRLRIAALEKANHKCEFIGCETTHYL